MKYQNVFGLSFCLWMACLATGCAQPGFWSKVKGAMPVGSPRAASGTEAEGDPRNLPEKPRQGSLMLDQRTRTTTAPQSPAARSEHNAPATNHVATTPARTASPVRAAAPAASQHRASGGKDAQAERTPEQIEVSRLAAARLRERRGHPDEAEPIYRDILKLNPNSAEAWHRLGIVCANKASYEESNTCFDKAFSLTQPTAAMLSDRGYAYYLQHDLDKAETTLRKAIETDHQNMGAVTNLGLVLGMKGQFDEALAIFKKSGTEAEAHANMGYIYTQLGALDHADAHYNHALTLDKNLKTAARAWIQVAEKRKALKLKAPPTSLAEKPVDTSKKTPSAVASDVAQPKPIDVASKAHEDMEVIDNPVEVAARRRKLLAQSAPKESLDKNNDSAAEYALPAVEAQDTVENASETSKAPKVIAQSAGIQQEKPPARHTVTSSTPAAPKTMSYETEEEFTPAPVMTPAQYRVKTAVAEAPVTNDGPEKSAAIDHASKLPAFLKPPTFSGDSTEEPMFPGSSRRTSFQEPVELKPNPAAPSKNGSNSKSAPSASSTVKPVFENVTAGVRQPPATAWGPTANSQPGISGAAGFGKPPKTMQGSEFNQNIPTIVGPTSLGEGVFATPKSTERTSVSASAAADNKSQSPRGLRNWFPAP